MVSLSSLSHSFRSVVGTANGKEGGGACHLPAAPAANPAPLAETLPQVGHAPDGGTGPSPRSFFARCWGHLRRVSRWLDDSWAGDLIGVICLFGIWYLLLIFGWALS